MARFVSRVQPARPRRRRTSTRQSRTAGSVPASSSTRITTPSSRSGRRRRSQPGKPYAEAADIGEQIRKELATDNPALLVLEREFDTQSVRRQPIVLGQAQGGFAMGVGYALLESLPLYEDGPGNGTWNLGQYLVARGSDLPLHALEVEVLPPVDPRDRPKGIAEVVMIPIVPALLSAIFDATGRRFRSLPVTQAMLKEAAQGASR